MYEKLHGGLVGYRSSLSGESIVIDQDLAAGAEARVEYRGTKWTARNVGSGAIASGDRAIVVKAEGLTLHVEAE